MNPTERKQTIMKLLNDTGRVEIDETALQLDVSSMTIRRDLETLEERGKLIRVHGGAVLPKPLIQETAYFQKESIKLEQKRKIANKAISFVEPGQTIILDSGTTTLEIAKLLKHQKDLTIITNDIKIAAFLLDSELRVIVTGGQLQNEVGTLYGPQTHAFFENIHVDIFFLGAPAVDINAGVTSPTLEKSLIKQLMIQAAETSWLVADSTKLDTKAFARVCQLDDLSGFITDQTMTSEQNRMYSNYINII